jgi:O-acetylserine/cysteine efflux transporter
MALGLAGLHQNVKTHLAPRDLALTLAVVALWGFAFVPIKWALVEVPPFMLAAARFAVAAIPAVLIVARPAMAWHLVAAYGLAIGVAQFGLLFLGMKLGMPAGLSSLVIQSQVFFTIGLAVAFAGDRLHRWNAIGALVGVAGLVVLGAQRIAGGGAAPLGAFLLVIASAVAWAIGNLIAKRATGVDMFSLVVWSSLVPPPVLALVSFATEGANAPFEALARASVGAWACIVFLGWGATLFGFSAWNRLLHRYPAPLISPFALLVPVSGLASGALFLGERLTPMQAAGVVLVFAGLALNVYGARLHAGWRSITGAAQRR